MESINIGRGINCKTLPTRSPLRDPMWDTLIREKTGDLKAVAVVLQSMIVRTYIVERLLNDRAHNYKTAKVDQRILDYCAGFIRDYSLLELCVTLLVEVFRTTRNSEHHGFAAVYWEHCLSRCKKASVQFNEEIAEILKFDKDDKPTLSAPKDWKRMATLCEPRMDFIYSFQASVEIAQRVIER